MHYILSKEETRVTEKLLDLLFLNCAQLCLTNNRSDCCLTYHHFATFINKFRICLTVHYKRLSLRKTTAKYVFVWKCLFVTSSCSKISLNVGHIFVL